MTVRKTTDTIVIHCTQTPDTMDIGADEIKKWHKNRGFDTIGYHFVIRRDGHVEKGRDINYNYVLKHISNMYATSTS